MFLIAAITGLLIAIAVGAFIYGTIQLSTYAFRISTGRGIAVLLFPPYTVYFAFAELNQEEKALPTASWVFGLFVTALLMAIFWEPISLLATGQTDKLVAKSPGEAAAEEYASDGSSEDSEDSEESASDESGDQESSGDESSASGDDSEESAEDEGGEAEGGDDESADEGSDDGGKKESSGDDEEEPG